MADSLTPDQFDFVNRFLGANSPTAEERKSFVGLAQARLRWERTLKSVHAGLRTLESAIRDATKDKPWAAEAAGNCFRLYTMLDTLDTRLSDKLDEALNAEKPEDRRKHHEEAKSILSEYHRFLASEEIFEELDENPFVKISVRGDLSAALDAIGKQIA